VFKFFEDQGIRAKIIIGYTSIFVLTSLLGWMFIYFNVKRNLTNNIQNELKNSTDSVLNMVKTAANVSIKNYLRAICETNIENIQAIYERYSSNIISEEEAKEEVRRLLFSQVIGKTGYVYCVNSQGIAVEHPNSDVKGKKDWANEPFVKKMIHIKHGYMEYDWKSPGEQEYREKAVYMSYFKPWDWILAVSTYTDELKDLINVDDFRQSVLSLKFGETGYSFIVDGQGNPIIHPVLKGNLSEEIISLDKDNIISSLSRLKTGKLEYSWKNPPETVYRKKLVIFNYIQEYDWIVASSGYIDEIYSILGTVEKTFLLSIVVMMGLGFLSTFWLSSHIIEPLNGLMEKLGMKVPDNLTNRIPVTSGDEIGKLIFYFNSFMEKLERYSDSLKKEVSEHRLTAEALSKSEWRYRNILKSIHEGYFEADLDGNIFFFNASMERITGYSNDELMGKSVFEITHDNFSTLLSDIFNGSGIVKQNSNIYEWELIKKDGSVCSVETSLSVMVNDFTKQKGILCVVRDVTTRIQTQKALQQSEEMFSKAFQCSPSGMFLTNIDNGSLISANDRFLSFIGYNSESIKGRKLLELDFFKHRKEGKKLFSLVNSEKSIRNKEIEFKTPAGEIRDGIISAELLQLSGETSMLAAIEDYTETRQLERQFLDQTERQRKEIAFALHDDLCPQLIGIEMLFEILKSKLGDALPDQAEKVDKIEILIQDSIRKTRMLSRGLCPVDIIRQGFDASLSELCAYVEDMFGIKCQLDCDNSRPFTDGTAATNAYYIAHEAVHNATKHADASHINIHFSTHEDKFILMIKDNGKGIVKQSDTKGMGIKIMEYRARLLRASLDIRNNASGGTIVLLEIDTPIAP
jgi:PAS domain S-box-containing protein